jgi:hypothetical protein
VLRLHAMIPVTRFDGEMPRNAFIRLKVVVVRVPVTYGRCVA